MDYKDFYNVFLAEMPWRLPGSNDFAAQFEMLKELVTDYPDLIEEANGLNKIEVGSQVTYWTGNSDLSKVTMIIDTEIAGNFCKVNLTSKNPSLSKGSPPFASDVYIAIKGDVGTKNLSLAAGDMMTDDAINLWKRLHSQGNKLSVFDTNSQRYVLSSINSVNELDQFIGGPEKQQYIFVLSENNECASGAQHAVAIMEIKRNSGYPIKELFEKFRKESK